MKLKKGILLTALTIIAITAISVFSNVQAAEATTPKTLKIKALRNSGYGYQVVNNATKFIWKIYDTNYDINETFYCIKGGPGFGSSDMDGTTINEAVYKMYFDMKDPDSITPKYLNAIIDPSSENYVKLMWVLEQCYIPPVKNPSDAEKEIAAQSKQVLLDAVEAYAAKYPGTYDNTSQLHPDKLTDNLTDDDIDAIQQLAVWYYTNIDDDYHIENNPSIKINSIRGDENSSYQSLDINNTEDAARINAINALYAYLTKTPKASDFEYNYKNTSIDLDSELVQIVDTDIKHESSENRIIVGPYKMEKSANVNYSLTGIFTDGKGEQITDIKYLDNSKNEVASGTTLKDLVGNNFYISIPNTTDISNIKFAISGSYFTTKITYWSVENPTSKDQPIVQIEKKGGTISDYIDYTPTPENKKLDLALRKFISAIKGEKLTGEDSREPEITDAALTELANGETLTVEKTHTKNPKEIKTGDTILYTIRIYNEGEVDGWATEVTDYLPEGLAFIPKEESDINEKYKWEKKETVDVNTNKTITYLTTNYLAADNKKLSAFEENGTTVQNEETGTVQKYKGLSYIDLQVECIVTATVKDKDQSLKNIAEITKHKDIDGNMEDIDRDSLPGNVTTDLDEYAPKNPTKGIGEQDDDDYEHLILPGKYFDLSLRKFISGVVDKNDKKRNIGNSREPVEDITPLIDGSGKTTAIYTHIKEPIGVSNGDIVTYNIRVYNEGKLDGYVTEITDHLPSQLEFIVDDELNAKYGWVVSTDGRTVKTDITSPKTTHTASQGEIYNNRTEGTDKVLLKAFEGKSDSKLDYIEVQIRCRVKDNVGLYEKITNIADITGFTDSKGATVTDRDSQKDNVTLPNDATLPEYKGNGDNKSDLSDTKYFYKGQQDDDDFEKLVLQRFDLALRKFITGIINGEKTTNITNRAPVFKKISNTEYTYEHTKELVDVANGNIVVYTLRVFNEGNIAGYATKVKDNIPEGLEFLPENSINTAFGWKMYKVDEKATGDEVEYVETDKVEEAVYVETDFLSKAKEAEKGDNLINVFDPETMTMPEYKDLKIAFKVTEPDTSDRIVINQAQISEDSDKDGNPIDDVDSVPNKWNDGEDDQDIEKIKVKYFDLSLKKWVTEYIVKVDGKTTITKSGHTGDENPEPPVKVEIQTGKINKTTVKFKYSIKVKNEGEIEGYATEIVDYIPEGLKFVAADNPKWTVNKDGKVVTDQLKDKLLQPEESATVDIVLTWINGKNNMGIKVNWAEISEDDNPYDSPDIDSTPGNNKPDEDDIDQAPVLLSPATGSVETYMTLTLSCITILVGGIFLIKKFVI